MPRTGQIIPEYLVPHVQTYINDNSSYNDISEIESEDGIRFINVFTSPKGEDGVVKMIKSPAAYIEEYGTPDYKLYGQPCYMPYVALQSGEARCWCMRVMPEDATYANVIIKAKVKVNDMKSVTKVDGEGLYRYNANLSADAVIPEDKKVTNAGKIYVGDYAKVGNDAEVTVRANAELDTIDYMESGVAYPGKWFSLIVDTGFGIINNEYKSKHGSNVVFTEADIKEAVAAGAPGYTYLAEQNRYVVTDTITEIVNEDGSKTIVADDYHYFVQWVDIEEEFMNKVTVDGATHLERTITFFNNTEAGTETHTLKIKFIPYIKGTTVSDFSAMDIVFDTESIPGLVDRDAFTNEIIENIAPVDDEGNPTVEDGYTVFPVIGVRSLGRGKCGNSLRIRITSDIISDKDNDFKNYIIEILDNDTTLVKKEYFRACMTEDAIINTASMFATDIINDNETGSDKIEMYVVNDNFTKIYDMYCSVAPEGKEIPTFEEFDFLFGKYKNRPTVSIPGYGIAADGKHIDGEIGIGLTEGYDGSFDINNPDRDNHINAAYIEAFTGNKSRYVEYIDEKGETKHRIETTDDYGIYDRAILSKRRTPAEFILDANYDFEVKKALVDLALSKRRYDAQCVIDATINVSTVSQAIVWAESDVIFDIDDPIISKECSNYKVKDPFNGKTITVTSTYNTAMNIPAHFAINGNHIPFVGEKYTLLNNFVKNSVKPAIDADDLEVKERLYTHNVNFYECIGENKFIKGVQTTSQKLKSDLSEMNHVAVLLDMKRQLEDYVSRQIYNFADASDRSKFTADAERMFANYVNSKIKTFSVEFAMNEFEEVRNILHCYLSVTFKTMAKRGIIEIDINKRVS